MSGSNVEETSEQTRGREMKHTARGRGRKDKHGEGLRGSKGADPRPSRGGARLTSSVGAHEEFMSFQDKVMSMFASVESRMEALVARMETRDQEIRQELAIYKTAVLARVMATHEAPRVEVPKPHTFSGKRDAKELDNFFVAHGALLEVIALTDEATKVRTATLYLTDNATLWWSTIGLPSKEEYEASQAHGLDPQLAKLGRARVEETWCPRPSHNHGGSKSLVDYRRGDSSKSKSPSKGNQAKGGGDKGSRGTLLRKDQAKALVARMAKARINGRSSHPRPIASCVMVHTRHGTALRGRL
ncbi:hypothetical protein CK203_043897 [Vitis vinifera]|uniref:Retrotransposon gag domain-containing protein n=1 Tax=Vitis vinifera TaxID=29760 RepID=A0A438HVI1_VITVI|nr:hypothetical protein CK203_043897 [Vitis vinifera]